MAAEGRARQAPLCSAAVRDLRDVPLPPLLAALAHATGDAGLLDPDLAEARADELERVVASLLQHMEAEERELFPTGLMKPPDGA